MKNIFKILSLTQKKSLIFILALMVVISLLEFISIGSIFPLLDVIFSEKLDRTIEKSFLTNFLGLSEESIFILLSLIFITFFFKKYFYIILYKIFFLIYDASNTRYSKKNF